MLIWRGWPFLSYPSFQFLLCFGVFFLVRWCCYWCFSEVWLLMCFVCACVLRKCVKSAENWGNMSVFSRLTVRDRESKGKDTISCLCYFRVYCYSTLIPVCLFPIFFFSFPSFLPLPIFSIIPSFLHSFHFKSFLPFLFISFLPLSIFSTFPSFLPFLQR